MNDDRDPIIDACLEEILGDSKPPDVLNSVLREWSLHEHSSVANASITDPTLADGPVLPVPLLPPVCEEPPVTVAVLPSRQIGMNSAGRFASRGKRRRALWMVGASALSLFIVAVALNLVERRPLQDARQTAEQIEPTTQSVSQADESISSKRKRNDRPRAPQVARQPAPSHQNNAPKPTVSPAITISESPSPGFSEQDSSAIERLIAVSPIPAAAPDRDVIREINSEIRHVWSRSSLAPAKFISDDDWFQRVFQVVLGRDPTADELGKLPAKLNEQQREQLVADLMHSERYIEEFARHWGELLTRTFLSDDLLAEGSLANRDGMLQYFRRALLGGVRFDQVAEEMLTATGTGVPGHPEYNGAANFLLARAGGKFEQATSDTSRLLLGRNVECLQCHDDFDQSRRQSEFWELNSFFRQLAVTRGDSVKSPRLGDVDFLGEGINTDGRNAVVYFEQPDGVLKIALPAFPGQPELPKSGFVTESNRRVWLAKCVTASPQFRQAVANRIWEDVYGIGLAPSDDIVGAEAMSPILQTVADQFAAHQYNLRKVIYWAVLSEPFAMPASDSVAALAMQSSKSFHRFIGQRSRPLRPVQQSLLAVAKSFDQPATNAATTAKVQSAPITDIKNGKLAIEGPASTPLLNIGTITADPIAKKFLANSNLSNAQKAQHLFQHVLHRQPRRRELEVIEKLLDKAGKQSESAWDSIWTALQSSAP